MEKKMTHHRYPRRAWIRRILFAVAAGLLASTVLAAPASAHGAVSDPIARHYGCYQRWPNGPTAQTATEDPMCYQAWQANPGAMWNWNGLHRDGVGGNHQSAVPDGQLCSGGMTANGRYAAFDEPGQWKTVDRPNRFTLNLYDQSSHGADYIHVYVTKQGFDPTTQRPRWSDLELAGQVTNVPTGTTTPVEVNAPGRTGHHIVYTVWQASHLDQSYYFCSDVNFTGGGPDPTPTVSPTTQPTPTTSPTGNPNAGCSATYRVVSQWSGGFQAEVRVTATSTAITAWTVNWALTGGERVSSAWGATVTTTGTTVSARNAAYNGSLGAGASTTFGFVGSGTSSTPALTCTTA
jgi:predicted carbohydrate-binding protein with CBM5 and CBM33 domain